ncbi:Dimerisation domain-containing protein [Actinacidiphila alni]|uniref:Dimerisation domain-containing protein n=1 Tax=Actinacidiphila alni TaxID=380248 RepID=A0A1I2LW24_9ACTN|nr:methyltransferase [Actinacidiphila alni]SFF81667.1 Dimerisation domain-containing protein [Actinacidiphila alni]
MPFKGELAQPSPQEAELAGHVDAVFGMLTGHWVAQTVRAAAHLRIADHVAAGATSADEVAAREGSDPATTYRLMRACASLGLLGHEGGRRFSVTPRGQVLREGVPGSLREAALVQGAEGHWRSWGVFPEAVRSGGNGAVLALGRNLFEHFGDHPVEGALFSQAMSNMTGLVVADAAALLDLGGATRVVDLGGADGALILALMRENPRIEGQVFDLPHVVGGAERAAREAGLADRFTAVAGDFFEKVPEADYYLLKWVLHDWSDEQCRVILGNCREAAAPGARVLVIEALVGEVGTPDPAAVLDMNMLAASDGQERDLAEYDALFAATGWRRTAVSPTRSLYSLIELEAV